MCEIGKHVVVEHRAEPRPLVVIEQPRTTHPAPARQPVKKAGAK